MLARAGLTARGVIYLLVGWVAVLVALGRSSREADQRGALQLLASKPYGLVSLWLLAIGFAAYALWRLSEAAFGVTGEPPGAGPRLKSLGQAVVYAGLAYLTFTVISGTQRSQSRQQQDITATAMQHTAGRWLVGIAGLAIVVVSLVLVSPCRLTRCHQGGRRGGRPCPGAATLRGGTVNAQEYAERHQARQERDRYDRPQRASQQAARIRMRLRWLAPALRLPGRVAGGTLAVYAASLVPGTVSRRRPRVAARA